MKGRRFRVGMGFAFPVIIAGIFMVLVSYFLKASEVRAGLCVGLLIALIQSFASSLSLIWAFDKNFFYWIWGGGLFFRMIVFSGTAAFIYRYTQVNLAAALLSLVVSTMFFLVIESWMIFHQPK